VWRGTGAAGIPVTPVEAGAQHVTATELTRRSYASQGHAHNRNSAASLGTFHDEKGWRNIAV